jgi:hypothetical protein
VGRFQRSSKLFHGANGSVIVEGRYTGTYKPTGKSMDVQVCHIWDVKNGKLTKFQQYVDTAKLHEAMRARRKAIGVVLGQRMSRMSQSVDPRGLMPCSLSA